MQKVDRHRGREQSDAADKLLVYEADKLLVHEALSY